MKHCSKKESDGKDGGEYSCSQGAKDMGGCSRACDNGGQNVAGTSPAHCVYPTCQGTVKIVEGKTITMVAN